MPMLLGKLYKLIGLLIRDTITLIKYSKIHFERYICILRNGFCFLECLFWTETKKTVMHSICKVKASFTLTIIDKKIDVIAEYL